MDAGLRLVIPPCRPEYFGSRPDQDHPPADHRSEQIHEIPRLRVSVSLQFRVYGAGLLQSELDGEVSATRGPGDSHAGLRRDACGDGAAFVLFLPAHRAARTRGAP